MADGVALAQETVEMLAAEDITGQCLGDELITAAVGEQRGDERVEPIRGLEAGRNCVVSRVGELGGLA